VAGQFMSQKNKLLIRVKPTRQVIVKQFYAYAGGLIITK